MGLLLALIVPFTALGGADPDGNSLKVVLAAPIGERGLSLSIEEDGESGAARDGWEGAGEGGEPTVVFSRPVADEESQQKGGPVPPGWLRIEPPVAGAWRPIGPRTIRLFPEKPLPAATRFTVTVEKVRALDGSVLAEPCSFSFSTERPAVLSVKPKAGEDFVPPDAEIVLTFNGAVLPETVSRGSFLLFTGRGGNLLGAVHPAHYPALDAEGRKRLEALRAALRIESGGPILVEARPDPADPRRIRLAPERPLPLAADIEVVVGDGVRGPEGDLTMGKTWRSTFSTLPPFAPLAVGSGPDRVPADPREAPEDSFDPESDWYLEFTSPIRPEDFSGRVVLVDLQDPAAEPLRLPPQDFRRRETVSSEKKPYLSLAALFRQARPRRAYAVRIVPPIVDSLGRRFDLPWEGRVAIGPLSCGLGLESAVQTIEAGRSSSITAVSRNVRKAEVRLTRLEPKEILAALEGDRGLPGDYEERARKVGVDVEGAPDLAVSWKVDLGPALDPRGRGIVLVEASSVDMEPGLGRWSDWLDRSLVQVTDLALTVKSSPRETIAWVTRISDGRPAAMAIVEMRDRGNRVLWSIRAGADGIAVCPGTAGFLGSDSRPFLAIASLDGDRAFAASGPDWDVKVPYRVQSSGNDVGFLGLVFTARTIYRPGERVCGKAIFRVRKGRDLEAPAGRKVRVTVEEYDPLRETQRTIHDARGAISPFGGFDFAFDLPPDARLGKYWIETQVEADGDREGWSTSAGFDVLSFRPPAFVVKAEPAAAEVFAGQKPAAVISGSYLAGLHMSGCRVEWRIERKTAAFVPAAGRPGLAGFSFADGAALEVLDRPERSREGGSTDIEFGRGVLGADGTLRIEDAARPAAPVPLEVSFEGQVIDRDRQSAAARCTVLVHPAAIYLGIRGPSGPAPAGKEVSGGLVALTPKGEDAAQVDARVALIRLEGSGPGTAEKEVAVATVRTGSPGVWRFVPDAPGRYLVRAEADDGTGRRARSSVDFLVVAGGMAGGAGGEDGPLELIPERPSWRPGETARLLIRAPRRSGPALLTVERDAVLERRIVDLGAPAIELPILAAHAPEVFVSLVPAGRCGMPEAPGSTLRPELLHACARLEVAPDPRRLAVRIDAGGERRPGERARVDVRVLRPDGSGARAEVALWAVDAGVLSLTAEPTPDPAEAFLASTGLGVSTTDSRLRLRRPGPMGIGISALECEEVPEIIVFYGQSSSSALSTLRRDFRIDAFWEGSLVTDAGGRASIEAVLPEGVTTYRVMAVAAGEGAEFGSGEADLAVVKPLSLRPALPRFLTAGDRASAGVVVHLRSGPPGKVTVRAEADGLDLDGDATREVDLRPGESAEVRFPWRAVGPGTAVLRFRAALDAGPGGLEEDGLEVRIPVNAAHERESVSLEGIAAPSWSGEVFIPAGADPRSLALTLAAASSPLADLARGVEALVDYPHGCLEQRSSRLRALVMLARIEESFRFPALAGRDLRRAAQAGLDELEDFRCPSSGGLSLWPGQDRPVPFLTAYAMEVLIDGRAAGFEVPQARIDMLASYLGSCSDPDSGADDPVSSLVEGAWILRALAAAGQPDAERAAMLFEKREALPAFARALLADALARAGDAGRARLVLDEVLAAVEAAGLERASGLTDEVFLQGKTSTLAAVLSALLRIDPARPAAGRLAAAILGLRQGAWESTQANAMALTALVDLLRSREATPDFRLAVRLDGREVLRRGFSGRAVEEAALPLDGLLDGRRAIRLALEGEGAREVRWAARLSFVPADPVVPALERGMSVDRRYLAMREDRELDEIRAGDLVRVELTLHPFGRGASGVAGRRHYAAVIDRLPAGLEAVLAHLETASAEERAAEEAGLPVDWRLSGFDRVEKLDDRVKVFATRLEGRPNRFAYVTRATTPGTFLAPPARAELLYRPDVRARTASRELKVVAR